MPYATSTDLCAPRPRLTRFVALVVAVAAVVLGCTTPHSTPTDRSRASSAPTTAQPASTEALGELQLHFLDVGQGDATIVMAPDATILIDAGRQDGGDVVPYLQDLGVSHIDVVVITHPHADHIGQLDDVLAAVDVDEVWMSGTPSTSQTFEEALAAIEASDANYEEPRAGDHTTVGSLAVDIVNPTHLTGEAHPDSLGMRLRYGAVALLFTGDAEAPTEVEMVARDPGVLAATVYQVGHHGSSTSTSPTLLAAVGPDVAIYSAGSGNSYGHPHPEVLARLAGAGVAVYGTDTHGTVTVISDGATYKVLPARTGSPEPSRPPESAPAPADTAPGGPVVAGSCQAGQIDVNTAAGEDLEGIVEIGPQRARQMVDLRPFNGLADLERVNGIGPATVQAIAEEGLACVS